MFSKATFSLVDRTCYYVVGLIAKTREGTDILHDLEWESIRHIGEDAWPVVETSIENKEEVIPFGYIRGESLSNPVSCSSFSSYPFSGMNETDRAGGIYLGEENKVTEGSTAYDKLSGIYLGEDKGPSRKASRDDANEGGILSQWYKNAERMRKIVTRERGHYDERSGVYLGEESSSPPPPSDGIQLPAPGGIMERLFAESGYDIHMLTIRESKLTHKRNFSEGNFVGGSFREKMAPYERFESKRRAHSNVDRVPSPLQTVGEHTGGDLLSPNNHGLVPSHKHTVSAPCETDLRRVDKMVDGDRADGRSLSETSSDSAIKIRHRSESEATDLSAPISMHVRSGSNLSSASMDSGDFLEMYISSRSRASSSTSEPGVYLQQNSPTNQSLMSIASDDTSKTLDDKDRPLNSSGESFQGVLSLESPPSGTLVRDTAHSSGALENGNQKEERKNFPGAERLSNELESRQRSLSFTEKRRIGSPSLGMIPETRSSSFSGSTEFSKIATKSRSSTVPELTHVPPMENLNDLQGSSKSLAEVKILSDKTIVFRASGDTKTRALSVDSASTRRLRRDRLLANSSQLSLDESDNSVSRSRGSSFEKADFARKLGLKSGDLSPAKRTRSTSSANSSTDGYSSKRILNKNKLCSSIENFTVVSGDTRRNSCASAEQSLFTSSRDVFGYTALSTLRRQRSFDRELEAKVNAFDAARTG